MGTQALEDQNNRHRLTPMTRCIIFDMDGVLTDSEPIINQAAIEGLKEFGVYSKPEDFLPFIGTGEDCSIGGVAELYGKQYTLAMKRRIYEIYLQMLPDLIKPFPGVLDMVSELRSKGIKMAVASSADRIKVEANITGIGIRLDTFQVVVVGEDIAMKKPAPDIYLNAAKKMNILPDHCCVIEDAINGIAAAKAAGMRCVAVEHSFPASKLAPAAPDCIRPRFIDITLADLGLNC